MSKKISLLLSILLLLLFHGCENDDIWGWLDDDDYKDEYEHYIFEIDPRLSVDDNGNYHLTLNRNSWQTLHRISGHVSDDEGRNVEGFWVEWDSNLLWYLGDTLGYIINRYLNNNGVYVSVDTSYIIGFSGQEVPTSNQISYSNSNGEINNMIAPVRSMVGDTMILTYSYWDGSGSISIVLD